MVLIFKCQSEKYKYIDFKSIKIRIILLLSVIFKNVLVLKLSSFRFKPRRYNGIQRRKM